MTPEMPIACSLNATELRTRLGQISALGHDALLRTDPDGTMHFRPDRATRDRLEAVIDAEARCCSFLHFELGEDRHTLTLRLVAPGGPRRWPATSPLPLPQQPCLAAHGHSLLRVDPKATVRRFVDEAVNGGRDELIDDVFVPNQVVSARDSFGAFRRSFPDLRMELKQLVAEGRTRRRPLLLLGDPRRRLARTPADRPTLRTCR